MGKEYTKVSNSDRQRLIHLIYVDGLSIIRAAEECSIFYPTAKAINQVYKKEQRVTARHFRYREKKHDAPGVLRNKLPLEKVAMELPAEDKEKVTCGIRFLEKAPRLLIFDAQESWDTAERSEEGSSARFLTRVSHSSKNIFKVEKVVGGGKQTVTIRKPTPVKIARPNL